MKKYRKKPVVIEAFLLERLGQILPDWFLKARYSGNAIMTPKGFILKTLEGDMLAGIGDYIIQGIKGEIYPCKADIFELTYEAVEDFVPHNID